MERFAVKLENEYLKISVSPVGAELQGLYSKMTHLEYLWQPGHDIWPHHSMLLFPNPGRIASDRVMIGGEVYPATMHGFVSDMVFDVLQSDEERILMELTSSPETKSYFPYDFRLRVSFALEKDRLRQRFYVINDDTRTVYFSIGAHPGFYCPIGLDERAEDYRLEFDTPQQIGHLALQEHTRLLTGEKTMFLNGGRSVKLCNSFFDNGPYLLDGVNAKTVALRSEKSGRFVELGIAGFPYMCLWGAPTRMSIFCIEPWCGISESVDSNHIWEEKPGIESVAVGKTFERSLTFRVG